MNEIDSCVPTKCHNKKTCGNISPNYIIQRKWQIKLVIDLKKYIYDFRLTVIEIYSKLINKERYIVTSSFGTPPKTNILK